MAAVYDRRANPEHRLSSLCGQRGFQTVPLSKPHSVANDLPQTTKCHFSSEGLKAIPERSQANPEGLQANSERSTPYSERMRANCERIELSAPAFSYFFLPPSAFSSGEHRRPACRVPAARRTLPFFLNLQSAVRICELVSIRSLHCSLLLRFSLVRIFGFRFSSAVYAANPSLLGEKQ